MAACSPPAVRFLFLHGYGQCRQTFVNQTVSLSRVFKKTNCTVVHLEAPFFAPPRDGVPQDESRSWWDTKETGDQLVYEGLRQSLALVAQEMEKVDPSIPHGLLGFSQGAGMASIVTALADSGDPRFQSLKMAILVGGFIPRDAELLTKYFTPPPLPEQQQELAATAEGETLEPPEHRFQFSTPALHVFGDADPVVLPERSAALAELFGDAGTMIRHPGKHYVPSNAMYSRMYQTWIEEQIAALGKSELPQQQQQQQQQQ